MTNHTVSTLAVLLCIGLLMPIAGADIVWEEDFETGLDGWTSEGEREDDDFNPVFDSPSDIAIDGGSALITDATYYWSSLYYSEGVALGSGSFLLEFDFLSVLSCATAPDTFPDTLFTTLYLTDDTASFDLTGDSVALLDQDCDGYYVLAPDGVVTASALGGDWLHFSLWFVNTHAYVVPTFELSDEDWVPDNASVRLDNVRISTPSTGVVPEPPPIFRQKPG